MQKEWKVKAANNSSAKQIQNRLQCHPATASILAQRGFASENDLNRYLNPSLHDLRQPFSLVDMSIAVNRLHKALLNQEKILIFGDYDVDGVTATTLLYQFLNEVGAQVSYYIPSRSKEGYGLKPAHITEQLLPAGIALLVTVDCGISNHEAVTAAQKNGIDVIITDHHDIPASLPAALAVINPKRDDCSSGLRHLAGVGIAFYLVMALRKYLREQGFFQNNNEPNLMRYCDLVALGTISDMVPLINENRILTRTGLHIIRRNERPGIKALADVCGLNTRHVDAEDISFKLGPRINAAGRMDHAKIAGKLLDTVDFKEAIKYAQHLNQFNSHRQQEEERVRKEILAILDRNPDLTQKSCLVFSSSTWHEGVVGIVAARLAQTYFKPAIVISIQNDIGKGSARSIPGIDITNALASCGDILQGFGGHSMAAGLQISEDKINDFSSCLQDVISRENPNEFMPSIHIDYQMDLIDITSNFIDEIDTLGPFGVENPEPVFMTKETHVLEAKRVGNGHRRMRLSTTTGNNHKGVWAIHFNPDPKAADVDYFRKIAYRVKWNRWNGNKSIQLIIDDVRI